MKRKWSQITTHIQIAEHYSSVRNPLIVHHHHVIAAYSHHEKNLFVRTHRLVMTHSVERECFRLELIPKLAFAPEQKISKKRITGSIRDRNQEKQDPP